MKYQHVKPVPLVNQANFKTWLATRFFILKNRGVSWGTRFELNPVNKFLFGKYARLEKGVMINNDAGDVIIQDEVHTGIGCIIIGPVELHKHVGLSQYVTVLGVHQIKDVTTSPGSAAKNIIPAPIIMYEDAFVGTGSVIQGKENGDVLTLGKYCRVGANSLVVDDVPAYSVVVGNPAKVVRVWNKENNCWSKP